MKWRVAQIYAHKRTYKEDYAFDEAARETKKTLLATGDYAVVQDDEDAAWDALPGLLYR